MNCGALLYSNHKGKQQTDLQFVFVHGLSGWGSYDTINTFFSYWGLSGGSIIDESWQSNDGLVNEISAGAPFNAPSERYTDDTELTPGTWYVMPTRTGDHMSLQGGMTKRVKIKPFYRELVQMLTRQFEADK